MEKKKDSELEDFKEKIYNGVLLYFKADKIIISTMFRSLPINSKHLGLAGLTKSKMPEEQKNSIKEDLLKDAGHEIDELKDQETLCNKFFKEWEDILKSAEKYCELGKISQEKLKKTKELYDGISPPVKNHLDEIERILKIREKTKTS